MKMKNEEIEKIISLDRIKDNNFYVEVEKVLKKERARKINIGNAIYQNAQKNSKIAIYFRFNTIKKYEEFYLAVYESRLFYKNGGMLYV